MVFFNFSFTTGYHHSSQSLSSVTLSMTAKDCKSSQVSTSSRYFLSSYLTLKTLNDCN